jgi:methionyl-tRNA formyltransferase
MGKSKILYLSGENYSDYLIRWLEINGEDVIVISDQINLDTVKEINPDLIISYGYRHIIKQKVIDHMKGEIVNLHISLLPYNRGAYPNFWSFIENTPNGVTIHKIDAGLDTGDILAQKEIVFDEKEETFQSSYDVLQQEIKQLFCETYYAIKAHECIGKIQTSVGSYHSVEDFNRMIHNTEFSWDKNIAQYKADLKTYKGGFS